jgi:nitronate monooxygenase
MRPFGLNLFAPGTASLDDAALHSYLERLGAEAHRRGVVLGLPRDDDDAWNAKLHLVIQNPVSVVAFTFGCPGSEVIARLHARDISV